jgi:choline-sulfatase
MDRYVYSEFVEQDDSGRFIPGRMVRQGKWKLISYHPFEDEDLLFDIENDSNELNNVIAQYPQIAEKLTKLIKEAWDIPKILEMHQRKLAHAQILIKWGQNCGVEEKERYAFEGEY